MDVKAKKTRLNKNSRELLIAHARRVVRADSRLEKDLEKTEASRDALRAKVVEALLEASAKKYPAADMEVLRRYECTSKVTRVLVFLDSDMKNDTTAPSEFRLRREELGVSEGESLSEHGFELPNGAFVHHHQLVLKGAAESTWRKWKEAVAAVEQLTEAKEKARREVLRAYEAFIANARWYEDVLEIWPEASELRDAIAPQCTALSVVTPDLLDLIRADVARRGKENARAAKASASAAKAAAEAG